MIKQDRLKLKQAHHMYHLVMDALKGAIKNPSDTARQKIIKQLSRLNTVHDLDFDNEIIDLKHNANYRHDTISIMRKFNDYMLNHVEPDTQTALKIVNHCLKPADYTDQYNPQDLVDAFRESYFYFAPCGDVATLRFDLIHHNYFNLKGDLKTIKSNREDLLHSSHTGNIKSFMGSTERKSVKRHNK